MKYFIYFSFLVMVSAIPNGNIKLQRDGHLAEKQKEQSKDFLEASELSILINNSKKNNTNFVQSISNRLREDERRIEYSNNKNIAIVLGNTGSGKSTLVQFIIGNNLTSVAVVNEDGEETGKYIIDNLDKNKNSIGRMSSSSLDSSTEIPELVLDVETNTWIYDCPGFKDSRGAERDIAVKYFIKKITDGKKIKFLFVVNYASVQIGYDRTDFRGLVRHATSMIKNITKFQDSIAIVATKVSPNESDDQIINTITAFLQKFKKDLINKKDASLSNSIQLVNAFLTTKVIENKKIYPRIGFFRSPNKTGLLSDMEPFKENRNYLRNLLHHNIKYTERDNADDFGYTIPEESHI